MSNELIQSSHLDTKTLQTRQEHIGQSLLSKDNFQHYMQVADFLSKSSMVPKGMQNKPADILIAMEMGLQIGVPMMQAIQDIAVINGKPCMYGDGLLAVVQGHKDFEWIKEEIIDEPGDKKYAVCIIKRKNHEPHRVLFSIENAKKASLWGKQGPWSQYPERMMQMRARGFCIRDIFSDALRGIKTEEEIVDYPDENRPSKKNKSSNDELLDKIKAAKVIDAEVIDVESGEIATEEQINKMRALLAVKVFDAARVTAAKEHYKVKAFDELTLAQAEDFIAILNKCPDQE